MLKISLLFPACAFMILADPALAHSPWLLPSATTLSDTNGWVSVDAAVSSAVFLPDHVPLPVDNVRVVEPDGTAGQIKSAAKERYRSVFDVQIDKPGTWRIGTMEDSVGGTFKVDGVTWGIARPWAKNFASVKPSGAGDKPGARASGASWTARSDNAQGKDASAGGVARRPSITPNHMVPDIAAIPANATELDLTQTLTRNEFFVTAGAPTTAVFTPRAYGLEMMPITHPDTLVSNEPARFRFLVDGKPTAGITVKVVPGGARYRSAENAQQFTTAADGTVTIAWPVAGMYWLNATSADDHPSAPRAAHRRMSYIATLEVQAP